jgi:hypothetical protein
LRTNKIYLLYRFNKESPERIASLINKVRKDRDIGLSLDEVTEDVELEDLSLGAVEAKVIYYFKKNLFKKPISVDSLQ